MCNGTRFPERPDAGHTHTRIRIVDVARQVRDRFRIVRGDTRQSLRYCGPGIPAMISTSDPCHPGTLPKPRVRQRFKQRRNSRHCIWSDGLQSSDRLLANATVVVIEGIDERLRCVLCGGAHPHERSGSSHLRPLVPVIEGSDELGYCPAAGGPTLFLRARDTPQEE